MKKFSKMLALGTALSLVFGMTAFAAESPVITTGITTEAASGVTIDSNELEVLLEDGSTTDVTLDVKSLEEEQIDPVATAVQEKSENIVTAAEAIVAATANKEVDLSIKPTVVRAFDVIAENGDGDPVTTITGRVTVKISWAGVEISKVYVAVHVTRNGDIEVVPVTVVGEELTMELTGLSPVAIVEVATKAKVNTNTNPPTNSNTGNNTTDNSGSSSTPDETKSPQTGEVLPMASILALICLAGAAVCAGKARYSQQQ